MKHFMQPRNAILRETQSPEPSSSPISGVSAKSKPSRKQRSSKENAPPSDSNSMAADPKPSPATAAKLKSPLPPRPPSSNPLKRKLIMETVPENSISGISDSGVKVVVRMRPPCKDRDEGEIIVEKLSGDSLSINGQTFNFDAVSDTEATQLDIFELVGAPLVENCMSGFNSSVFAYGQTGSGKTYTMWGPANALSDENSLSDQQGLTPRVFEHLFARISEEQIKHTNKQLKYQCHCSFLEIYNEQITDLLDPNRKNLQIREDVKSGVYVENLSEECVSTMADVTQLLKKGLSNRRTGATSINSESSRSHTVFTCVVESRCKIMADGLSSFKTSRINLVDLAGSERQKLTGAAGERLKEAGNINRSLSQLGNLINILAEISHSGKQRHIPYRDSRLTFLLQDSLGGNAKLAMICSISPAQSCKSETFSTLRFAQRAKSIKNKAVVNEVMQDDVKHLREVIRQLKDELHRIKENGNNPNDTNEGHSTAWLHRSLSLLKSSLHRPVTITNLDDDSDEEMEIDEEAVEKLCVQLGNQSAAHDIINLRKSDTSDLKSVTASEVVRLSNAPPSTVGGECAMEECEDVDVKMEVETSAKDETITRSLTEIDQKPPELFTDTFLNGQNLEQDNPNSMDLLCTDDMKERCIVSSSLEKMVNEEAPCKTESNSHNNLFDGFQESISFADARNSNLSPSTLSIVTCNVSPVFNSPTPSISPRLSNSRKSLRTSSMLNASRNLQEDSELVPEDIQNSLKFIKSGSCNRLSAQISKSIVAPTEQLAESIRNGLDIIDSYRQSLAVRRSSFRFPFKPAELKVNLYGNKVDVGVQTLSHDEPTKENLVSYVCNSCKSKMIQLDVGEADDSSNLQLVPVDDSDSAGKSKMQLPKAVEKVLAGAIRREMALEEFCSRQASEIVQLNRLVQQYKHERECNSVLGQTREDKILRLESLMDGVLPTEDFMEEELVSLTHEHKVLKEKYENHPEVLRTQIELKRTQDVLEKYRNFYDLGEKEVLLEEIQDLRSQLHHYYVDSSCSTSRKHNAILQLNYYERNLAPPLSSILELTEESHEEKLQQEKIRWTETESKWISLSEELRSELEACRSLSDKKNRELEIEKKCGEELKEAMQMAMKGHARLLEQYTDLEEKHMQLLARHRKIQEGIVDVKKAASKAGVKNAESKFINALASEISALKVEREKERRYFRDENKGLQAQLRDTVEAVQAAGDLLVRLREAEEAVVAAQKRALEAEQETEKAYKQIEKLNKKHEKESGFPNEAIQPSYDDTDVEKYDKGEPHDADDQQWRTEFEPFFNYADGELPKCSEPPSSWFSGYDRCNI